MLALVRYDWEERWSLAILPWYRKVLRWEWWRRIEQDPTR